MYKRDQKQYKKKDRDEAEGNFVRIGSKRVTAASRMPEEHIFCKNA